MAKRVVFEGVGEIRNWKSTWYPERPEVLKTHTLGMIVVNAIIAYDSNGSTQEVTNPWSSESKKILRIEEKGLTPDAVDNVMHFFRDTYLQPGQNWNCHSFGYTVQDWPIPTPKKDQHLRTRDLIYKNDDVQAVFFDELHPGVLHSITSNHPNTNNYHSFIPLSEKSLTLSAFGPDGPLVIADIHDLFTYYGGERLYRIEHPANG